MLEQCFLTERAFGNKPRDISHGHSSISGPSHLVLREVRKSLSQRLRRVGCSRRGCLLSIIPTSSSAFLPVCIHPHAASHHTRGSRWFAHRAKPEAARHATPESPPMAPFLVTSLIPHPVAFADEPVLKVVWLEFLVKTNLRSFRLRRESWRWCWRRCKRRRARVSHCRVTCV